jgi:Domain of unknown function (DUF4157)/Heterokaryon incompatibility protein Het-C
MFAAKITKTDANSTNTLVFQRSPLVTRRFGDGVVGQAHMLQRSSSNEHPQAASLGTSREGSRRVSWDFSNIPTFSADGLLEREADHVADQVTRMPKSELSITGAPPQLNRKCAACEAQDGLSRAGLDSGAIDSAGVEAPAIVGEVLRSPGQPLDPATQAFMEPRFGRDLSLVRVHADASAARSAGAVRGLAYTVGRHIVFAEGRYAPASPAGRWLLAHELTHVVQQGAAAPTEGALRVDPVFGAGEREANRAASEIFAPTDMASVQTRTAPAVARFSDTGHHIIEEAALGGAGFSKDQTKAVERGNIERDYSQVGWIGNTALLCKPHDFGGYKPEEHFDNFMWDAVTRGWRTRGASALGEKGVDIGRTPIDYIGAELEELADRGSSEAGLRHLGNAFHTVEDFFAHSNFVELISGDTHKDTTLMTGNPIGPSQSESRILEAISPPGIRERYREESEKAIAAAAPGTHTAMAHDDPTTQNYTLARRLAALVIQELGREVLAVMSAPPPERPGLMRERVLAKVVHYLRPPDPKDRWWETLTEADAGQIDIRLDKAARETPTTVNQCALSPLKNLEASQDSPLSLPIGVAIPTIIRGDQVWFQIGAGVNRPFPLAPTPDRAPTDDRQGAFVVGAQVTGRF